MSPFDFIKILHSKERTWDTLNDEEKKSFNIFIINKALSMNPNYLELVNTVQRYTNGGMEKREVFNLYQNMLPKNNKYYKWIKSKTDSKYANSLLVAIGHYFECSTKEASDYLDLMPKKEIKTLLENIGFQDKEIKSMMK